MGGLNRVSEILQWILGWEGVRGKTGKKGCYYEYFKNKLNKNMKWIIERRKGKWRRR